MKKVKIEGRWVRRPGNFFEKPKDVIEQRFDYFKWKKDNRFQAYLQNELKYLPNGKFEAPAPYVVIKYPLGADIKNSVRPWVSEADKHFKSLPAKGVEGYYNTYKGKWIRKAKLRLYSELSQPWGFFTNIRELLKKRNNWIKEKFEQLMREGKSRKEAYNEIARELPFKRGAFGSYSGAKGDPLRIKPSAIEHIIRYK